MIDQKAFKHAYQDAADWVSSNPEVHERYPHAPMIEAAIVAYERANGRLTAPRTAAVEPGRLVFGYAPDARTTGTAARRPRGRRGIVLICLRKSYLFRSLTTLTRAAPWRNDIHA
jgi:hypothetical protein